MENKQEQKNINMKDNLLKKIRTNEITMRPKYYFIIKIVLIAVVSIIVLVVSVAIFNFISFTTRINGHDSLLGFGLRGFIFFLELFPWLLLIIDIVFVVLLEWLLRRFRFGNKIPVLYLLIAILIIAVSVGLVIDRGTSFNDNFLNHADQHHLPMLLNNYFENARQLPSLEGNSTCKCIITAINGNVISAQDIDFVVPKPMTIVLSLPGSNATTSFSIGDVIFVAGRRHGNIIEAFGVSKLPIESHL